MKFEGSIEELRSLAGCDQIEKLAIANERHEMLRAALDHYRRNAGLPALHQSDIAGQLISGNISSLTPAQLPQYQQPQLPQYQQPQYQLPAAPSYWPEPISAIATPVATPAQMFQEYSGTSAMTVIQPNEPSLLAGAMTVMDGGQPESKFMAFINSRPFTFGIAIAAAVIGLYTGAGADGRQWALQKLQSPQSPDPALVAPPATEEPPAPVPAQ